MKGKAMSKRANFRPVDKESIKRKRAEGALRRSEKHSLTLVENTSDVIMILNSDGTTRHESPSIEKVTGYQREEREGKSILELVHPEDKQNATCGFDKLLEKHLTTVRMEFRLQHKDGSWRVVDAIAKNLLDDPVVAGIVANLRDITEHEPAGEASRLKEEYLRPFIQTFSWI